MEQSSTDQLFLRRVSVPDHVLMRTLESESVILNLNSGCYFGLDEMSTSVWTALIENKSVQAAFETLLAEYNVDAERLRQDLLRFIKELQEHDLVEING